jgi:tetratricopeptide (TPR) repeat protein
MNSVKNIQINTQKQKAMKLFAEGKYGEASVILKSIHRMDRYDVEVLTGLAHCSSALRQPTEALLYLDRALHTNPNYLHAQFLKGCVLGDLGQYQEGIDLVKNVINRGLDDFEMHGNLGILYQDSGDFNSAITAYLKALSFSSIVNPEVIENRLANCYSELGQFPEAMKIYDKLIFENDQDTCAIYNKAVALEKMGNSAESLKLLKQVVIIDPDFLRAWDELADLYEKIGALDMAKKCRTKAENIRSKE